MRISATGKRKADNRAGFTVFELVLVMIVMVVTAAMVLPSLPGYMRGTSLRATAARLGGMARYARDWAVTHERTVTLSYDSGGRAFTLAVAEEDAESVLAVPVVDGEEQTTADDAPEIDSAWRTLRLPQDVTLESGETATGDRLDGAGEVRFFPDGRADEATVVLGTDRQRWTVVIEGKRGRVVVEVGDGETSGPAAARP